MAEVLYYAFPYFVLLLVVEFLSFRHYQEDDGDGLIGYDLRDSRTSISMGIGNVIINVGWKFVVLALYTVLYELAPWHLPTDAWWVWVALFFADDFSYYWFHRVSHESRAFWASHVVHHSSEHYNLSTALRQTWVPMTYAPFWLWMPLLGFAPWMVLLAQAWSLIYQGGIHVIWDRLFGTWEPEGERVRYGLTTNIETHNVVRVAFHEYVALWGDIRRARSWKARAGYALHGPGWTPAGSAPDSGPGAVTAPI